MLALAWTPLVSSDMFTGIQTDLGTLSGSLIGLVLILLGVGLVIRAMSK